MEDYYTLSNYNQSKIEQIKRDQSKAIEALIGKSIPFMWKTAGGVHLLQEKIDADKKHLYLFYNEFLLLKLKQTEENTSEYEMTNEFLMAWKLNVIDFTAIRK